MSNARPRQAVAAGQVIKKHPLATTTSAMRLVRLVSGTLFVCSPSSTYDEARVYGLTLQAGNAGQIVDVLIFGPIQDNSFLSFSSNEPLYLGPLGAVTNTVPSLQFHIKVGYALGTGEIQFNPQVPIKL